MQFEIITIGFSIFLGIHLITLIPRYREALITKFGETRYKLGFSLFALSGLGMMLIARFYAGEYIKPANSMAYGLKDPLMYFSILLLVSAEYKDNYVKAFFKHPMLLGIGIWSSAHILFNQHLNHILFFSFFSFFSAFMLIGVVLRDRKRRVLVKTPKIKNTVISVVLSVLVFIVIKKSHIYIAGVNI